ncbi:diacylglycerol kinase family protein [Streptomyces sp. ODS28]|uniref:diacylglycerol/lipid kinase family protein n=1 Tax=Streptomyces sp. ODS28 TaxID=3136688 RepID=UPI0031ED971C
MDGRHYGSRHSKRRTPGPRWPARAALAAALGAALVLLVFAGLRTLALLATGAAALVVALAAVWWALTRRGVLRWLAVALAVAAPLLVLVLYVRAHLAWVVALSAALWLLAVAAGRSALVRADMPVRMPESPAGAVTRPVLFMNPRSGGGKVARFQLDVKARELGAEVVLLEGPGTRDVVQLAEEAATGGADLLGVAGGDGTQALVAGVAATYGLPFLVVPAGTRNHFALDLGLDRTDPALALEALRPGAGVELRVDLASVGGRPFVNNASFGAYAEVVQSASYREGKTRTVADLLPEVLAGHQGARLTARMDGWEADGPQALLVGNNPYGLGDLSGLGRRARLDAGVLGVVGVTVSSAAQAAGLLRGRRSAGVTRRTGPEVVVYADAEQIPVGVDGEALSLPVPVRCVVRPGALRVLVPRNRPGVPPPRPRPDWRRLLALGLRPPRGARSGGAGRRRDTTTGGVRP